MFDERAALFAVGFYSSVPLSYYFTRTIQPDAMAAFGTILGIYFVLELDGEPQGLPVWSASATGYRPRSSDQASPTCIWGSLSFISCIDSSDGISCGMPIIWLFASRGNRTCNPLVSPCVYPVGSLREYSDTTIRVNLNHPGLADPLLWDRARVSACCNVYSFVSQHHPDCCCW